MKLGAKAVFVGAVAALFPAGIWSVLGQEEAPAKKGLLAYYDVPTDPTMAWGYAVAYVGTNSSSFERAGLDAGHLFVTLWYDGNTLRLKTLKSVNLSKPGDKGPDAEDVKVRDWSIPYSLKGDGWEYSGPSDSANFEKKSMGGAMKEMVLDNVFIPFPETLDFKKGIAWGAQKEDQPDTFFSDTPCTRWQVFDLQESLPNRRIAVLRSAVWDTQKDTPDSDLMFREKTVHYDVGDKRVRFAWNRYRYCEVPGNPDEIGSFDYQDTVIYEMPPRMIHKMIYLEETAPQPAPEDKPDGGKDK